MANSAATEEEKASVLADAHFLRALIYFDLNNYWGDPISGYTVPLLEFPLGIDDRVSCATTADAMAFIETEIESARTNFQVASAGISNYYAATALAARIYFYHEKYDLAYARADEVINSNQFSLESDVSEVFVAPGNSNEIIFKIMFNSVDGSGVSPSARIFEAYQNSATNGFYSLNPNGVAAGLIMDETDARYTSLYSADDNYVYVEKYSTDQMHYQYIRLAEMYLTRAEADIMVNGSVNQQDVDDINVLRNRAKPSSVLTSIPTKDQTLDLIFVQRGNTIGKIALVREELGDATINPVVLIFRAKNANPYFLLYLLMNKGLNREFVNSNSGSAQPMITQKTMKEFLMIDVPVSLQNQFAERVQAIEAQKAQAQESLAKAEDLFNSLLQKAFKGELV